MDTIPLPLNMLLFCGYIKIRPSRCALDASRFELTDDEEVEHWLNFQRVHGLATKHMSYYFINSTQRQLCAFKRHVVIATSLTELHNCRQNWHVSHSVNK